MRAKFLQLKMWFLGICLSANAAALFSQTITGTVFYDLNANAAKDATESGAAGITVTAYNSAGASAATATTAAAGTFTLSGLTNGQTYRVEFTNLPSGFYNTIFGTGSGTTVQFITAPATTANLGICHPTDYCQTAPNLAIPCYDAGASNQPDFNNVNTHPGIVSFPSTANSTSTAGISTTPAPTKNVAFGRVGATWGGAWKKNTNRMFYSAVLKRHVDLGEFARPSGGSQTVDGVYMADYSDLTATYIGGFRLQGVSGIDLGTVSRSVKTSAVSATAAADDNSLSSVNRQSRDLAAFSKVGKVGFGDITMSEDYNYLWLVNLHQRSLIRVDVSNQALLPTTGGTVPSSLVTSYNINFSSISSCNGTLRPWALTFYHGKGYVGVVCDGSTGAAADLKAYVLSFDPANVAGGFTKEFEMALNFTRENAAWPTSQNASYRLGTWRPWTDTWSLPTLSGEFTWAEPILSNIEFTVDGSMVLGFLDRGGVQFDFNQLSPISANSKLLSVDAAGDIVYVCNTGGIFKVEGDAGCVIDTDPGGSPAVSLANDGPKNVGEFFYQDMAFSKPTQHMELTLGGLAMLLGTQQVFSNAFDPITENFNQGAHWYSTSTGKRTAQYQITPNGVNKGVGLGEPELMCSPPPIQIGNFVWKDSDADGVQDAGEPPLQGVTVKLYAADGTTVLGSAVTDANGQFYFSSATGTSTANNIYGVALAPTTNYYLKITSLGSHSSVSGLALTGVTTGGSTSQNSGTSLANNDAAETAGIPTIYLKTGFYGENNDTYDFGFTGCAATATVSASPSTVCAGQNISLSVSGGASGATYSWSGPNGFSSGSQNPTVSGATADAAGTYLVTVTNAPGCSATGSVSVAVTTVEPTAGNAAGCLGGPVSLFASGGDSYSWSGPNSFSSTYQNPSISISVAADAGVYAVQVTKNGCSTAANTTVVLMAASTSASSNSPLCSGATLELSASSSGTTYNWTGPSGFTSTLQNPTVSPAVAGTYNVTITGGTCAGNTSVVVVVNPTPVATVTKGIVCVGESIQLHATGGSAYAWSGPNGFYSTSSDPVISPAVLAHEGTYSVTITGASTVCSASVPVQVTTGQLFLTNYAEIISADQTVVGVTLSNNSTTENDDASVTTEYLPCTKPNFSISATSATCSGASPNSNAQINLTGITSGTHVSWSIGQTYTGSGFSGATSFSGSTYTISGLENPSDTLRYVVRIFNNGDCCVKDLSVLVYPAVCPAASNNSPICLGGSIQLQASGGATYAWSGPNSFSSTSQNPTISGATAAMAGVYTVTVTTHGNSATATTTVSLNIPAATASANSPVATGQAINFSASGGATFSWSGPNGFASTEQNPTISSAVLANGGTYTVTATSADGCTATASVAVSVFTSACSQAVTAAVNTVCEGATINLTASPTVSGASYVWSGPNSFGSTEQNPTITNATDDHHSGTYSVTVTTSGGCTGTSSVVLTVGIYPEQPLVAGATTVNAGEQIQLTATGGTGDTFSWLLPNSTTQTGAVVTVPSATAAHSGNFVLTTTSSTGCARTDTVAVTVNPLTHLILAKTADKTTVTPGSNETIIFTITLTNSGGAPVPSTQVRDLLPSGFTYVSSSASSGSYDVLSGVWNVGTAPVGNSTLTITATVQ